MNGMNSSKTVIHSSLLCVNVRITWEGKFGSAEDNEINKAETPRRKSGNSTLTPACSHTQSDYLMKQLSIHSGDAGWHRAGH